MKGLLYKDILLCSRTNRFLLLMIVGFFLMFSLGQNEMLLLCQTTILLSVSACFGIFSYDERVSWQTYCHTTPILRWKYVLSKYILIWMLAGAVYVLFVITQIPLSFQPVDTVAEPFDAVMTTPNMIGHLFYFSMIVSEIVMILSATLPLIFAFGVEKARLGYFFTVGGYYAFYGILDKAIRDTPVMWKTETLQLSLVLLVISCLMFLASLPISIVIYNRRKVL